MSKENLETEILEVLAKHRVPNQSALAALLGKRGIFIDQSTLSRNLAKLGIQKKDGVYHLAVKSSDEVQVVPVPPNLVIVKTLPGHAQAFAFKLDNNPIAGVVGTIAGDDTVLCVVESPKMIQAICSKLMELG